MDSAGHGGVLMQFLAVAALLQALLIQTTESVIPFGANYGASTDASHTKVQGGGSHVDLVLDASSGQ
jgi:hypothetical protein